MLAGKGGADCKGPQKKKATANFGRFGERAVWIACITQTPTSRLRMKATGICVLV